MGGRLFLLMMTWSVITSSAATPVLACPFCGTVGQSLAERRDQAAVVAVGEAAGPATADAIGFLFQPFRIDQRLRGHVDAADAADAVDAGGPVSARVTGPVNGTAVLFGTVAAAAVPGADRHRWSAVASDESLLGHVAAAPAVTLPAAERLRWFAARLEHPDPAIAADAFTEFGLAPFAAVSAAADAVDQEALQSWVSEPGIDQRRRGLYGLLLGVVAFQTQDESASEACNAALHRAIETPADDFRTGFDGLLAGVLVAEGADGLEYLRQRGFLLTTARALDQRHLLSALRFAWESLADRIPRQQISTATATLLASPSVAADAVVDLARYQDWNAVADVARLWDTLGGNDPLIRRAVAGYLAACPLPVARQQLQRLRGQDAALLQQALDAAALPAAR